MTFIQGFDHFITRKDDQLYEGGQLFRFISLNVPNLHVNEDPLPHWHRVVDWEIDDAFKTLQALGGRATRCYTLSIRGGIRPGNGLAHIYAPNVYEEELFKDLDKVVASAHHHGIRLILPFIDQWDWFGGIKQFAAFHGKEMNQFWTDPAIIHDFKAVISYVMNRVNTVTGIRYKEDKAILAWETGNELESPDSWIAEIISHIKSEEPKQLILDGRYGISEASVVNPDIDIVSNHYYIDRGANFLNRLADDRALSQGKKAFLIGEFGHGLPSVVEQLLEEVIRNGSTGALIWSLRYRSKDGGFYFQGDPDDTRGHSYIWPESPTRANGTALQKIELLRQAAYRISGKEVPDPSIPDAPVLLPAASSNEIRWRGSVGALSYTVERAISAQGPWETIADQVVEHTFPYEPYADRSAGDAANQFYYRMRAMNSAGISEPSNIIATTAAESALLD